jgi:hypothetical protein
LFLLKKLIVPFLGAIWGKPPADKQLARVCIGFPQSYPQIVWVTVYEENQALSAGLCDAALSFRGKWGSAPIGHETMPQPHFKSVNNVTHADKPCKALSN